MGDYLYTRVGSSGRGVQASEPLRKGALSVIPVRVRGALTKGELSSVIGGGYWRR